MGISTGLLAAAFVAVAIVVALMFTVRRARSFSSAPDAYPALAQLRRNARLARLVGLALTAGVLWLTGAIGGDRWLATAPVIIGLILIGSVIAGERASYRAAQQPGEAAIERRNVSDYVPKWLAVASLVGIVLLVGALIVGAIMAGPDGRSVEWGCTVDTPDGPTSVGGSGSPFPGAFYGPLVAAAVVVLIGAAVVALWMVAARPRNGADPALVTLDDALRRQTAEGILAAVLLAISATMLGIGAFGASAVSNIGRVDAGYVLPDGTFFQVPDCPAEPLVSFAKLLFPAVAWLGLVGTLVGFGSLLWPRAVVRR